MKKVVMTNIILFSLCIIIKIWDIYLMNYKTIRNIAGIGKDFFNLYIQISDDVLFVFKDFSVYVLLIGLLINLFFLYRLFKRHKVI